MNDIFSDKELKDLFGLRLGGIAIFEPNEMSWVCSVDPGHRVTWSEYNEHIWCFQSEKDYFSLLCPKQLNPFTTPEIVLSELDQVLERFVEEGEAKVEASEPKEVRGNCEVCGAEFEILPYTRRKKRFCGSRCQKRAERQRRGSSQ